MSALTTVEKLTERFSVAVEDRSAGYQDLVSNANAILYLMKERDQFKSYSGPTIRERLLYAESGTYTRISGWDFMNPAPAELVNDAEFEAKMAMISIAIAMEDINNTSGKSELVNLFTLHMDAGENELEDRFVEDVHSAGALYRQIGGFQKMIPTDPTTGTYGGISRASNAIWRTFSYDAHSFYTGYTQVNSTSVRPMLERIVIERSRGKKGPNVIASAKQHYEAYSAATVAIQRITDETKLGKLGFTSLRFYGAGKSIDMVLEGGIGSAMPDDVSYVMDTTGINFRYNEALNFSKAGDKMMPVNQYGIVQHIGYQGELTLKNPLHQAKLYDSTPAS